MSRTDLIPQKDGRPAVMVVDGWTVFVSIRDAAYEAEMKRWRQRLAAVHPDRGGSAWKFRKVMGQRIRWQCEEARWYARLGLLPPDGFRHAEVQVERTKRLRGEK